MKNIKFGCIAPIPVLNVIPKEWNFHLLLAHLLTDEDYVNFYKQRQSQGDYLLLDNSAFEFGSAISAEKILKLISDSGLKPNCVVAPDYPGEDSNKTVDSLFQFLEDTKNEEFTVMGVPQSVVGDYEGWIRSYSTMINIQDPRFTTIGMSILGIPTAFCELTGTNDIMFNRIFATSMIVDKQWNVPVADNAKMKWHHYLGLGQPRELVIQKTLGLIDSNDSSNPVWHGMHGITYDNSYGGLINGKLNKHVNFNQTADKEDLRDIQFNLEWFKKYVL